MATSMPRESREMEGIWVGSCTEGFVIWAAGLSYPDVNSLRVPEFLTSLSFNPTAHQQPSLPMVNVCIMLHNLQQSFNVHDEESEAQSG